MKIPEIDNNFLKLARAYWKYAPSGEGKIDTSHLEKLSNEEFLRLWERSKRIRRENLWEEAFFISHFAKLFAGLKVLSFGCGLAYSETEFLENGTEVTFADIVDTNIHAVKRLCNLKNYTNASFKILSGNPNEDLGGPYDVVFAYGSLMHMPEDSQAKVLMQFFKSLNAEGQLVLMLYTPEFVKSTGSSFDQKEFARRSDPSVGDVVNPWSDWHDDQKLERLAADFLITKKQLFHEDRFVWYSLAKKKLYTHYIDLVQLQENNKETTYTVNLSEYILSDGHANFIEGQGLQITTGDNQYHYALKFPIIDNISGETLAIQIDIQEGGASIGILDVERDCFVASKAIQLKGEKTHYLGLSDLPKKASLVVSNFQPEEAGVSQFRIISLRVLSQRSLPE